MKIVDLLRMLSPVLMIVAIALLATRRRLIRSFEQAGATSPESATAVRLGGPLGRWWLKRFTMLGIVQASTEGNHWIDLDALAAYRSARRRRAVTIVIVILLSMTLLAVLSRGK